jgi:hypothetical protein
LANAVAALSQVSAALNLDSGTRTRLGLGRGTWVAISILLLIGAVATPFAMTPIIPVPGFMTAFGAAMIVINVLLAAILFSRGSIEHRRDATALGSAYLYVALILLPARRL